MSLYEPPQTEKSIPSTFPRGRHSIGVRLRTREVTNLRVVDIRFINLSWLRRPSDAPMDKIEITRIDKIEWGDGIGPEGMKLDPNGVGGFQIKLTPHKLWAAGDYIYLEITFEARAAWSGYLSFEGRADHRARRRSRIAILEDALSGSY